MQNEMVHSSPIRKQDMLNQQSQSPLTKSMVPEAQMIARRVDSSLDLVNQGDVVLNTSFLNV